MSLKSLLEKMQQVADENSISTPYIVGGLPRDILLNNVSVIHDIDITTGSEDVNQLAELFGQTVNGKIKTLDDHKQVQVGKVVFDFSTNFVYENIDELGVGDDPLVMETFSRDFTINALLMPLDFSKILDPTNKGKDDIDSRVLECPVDCSISFEASPNRMLRAFFYKARHGFDFSDNVAMAIKNNLNLLEKINKRYASEMLNNIVREDPKMLIELLETGALHKLPLTKYITRLLLEKRKILDVI